MNEYAKAKRAELASLAQSKLTPEQLPAFLGEVDLIFGALATEPAVDEQVAGLRDQIEEMAAQVKISALDAVRDFATEARTFLAKNADQYKLAGWADKARRAERYLTGAPTSADTAILTGEAVARGLGETVGELAGHIVSNAAGLAKAQGVIEGMENRATAAIQYATIDAEIEAILTTMRSEADQVMAQLMSELA